MTSLSKLRHVRESSYIFFFMVFSAIIEVDSQINVEFQVGNVDSNKDLSTLTRDIQQQLSIYNISGNVSNMSVVNFTAYYNPCPKGFYCTQNLTKEIPCPVGTFQPILNATDAGKCLNCSAGTFQTGTGMPDVSNCTLCSAGEYSTGQRMSNSLTCLDCSAGKYSTNLGAVSDATCLNCRTGTYSTAIQAVSVATCMDCQAGTYGTGVGFPANTSEYCIRCGTGFYSTASGANLSTTCVMCQAGTYGTGTGFPDNTPQFCTRCGTGLYSTASGANLSTTCVMCQAGTYGTGTGFPDNTPQYCTLCGLGSFSTALGANANTTCEDCQSGTYGTGLGFNRSSLCTWCPQGTYQPLTRQNNYYTCRECRANYYCLNPKIEERCPIYTFSLPNSSTQLDCRCEAGYYCAYKQMITAVVSMNISKAAFENNTNNVQTNFKTAVAIACGVKVDDVIITKIFSSMGGGARRRMLEFHSDGNGGINVVANALGANNLDNLDEHMRKMGIMSGGHVWSRNNVVLNKPTGFRHGVHRIKNPYHFQQHHKSASSVPLEDV
jgi:hypothetical protein